AGRDPLILARDLTNDVGLPADEVSDDLRLVPAPGEVVLRLCVAIGPPQVVPRAQAMRPVDETPLLIRLVGRRELPVEPGGEPLEDLLVMQQDEAGLVVDLIADDGRVVP